MMDSFCSGSSGWLRCGCRLLLLRRSGSSTTARESAIPKMVHFGSASARRKSQRHRSATATPPARHNRHHKLFVSGARIPTCLQNICHCDTFCASVLHAIPLHTPRPAFSKGRECWMAVEVQQRQLSVHTPARPLLLRDNADATDIQRPIHHPSETCLGGLSLFLNPWSTRHTIHRVDALSLVCSLHCIILLLYTPQTAGCRSQTEQYETPSLRCRAVCFPPQTSAHSTLSVVG